MMNKVITKNDFLTVLFILQETNDFDVLTSIGMQSVSDLSERLDDVWQDGREIILRRNDDG